MSSSLGKKRFKKLLRILIKLSLRHINHVPNTVYFNFQDCMENLKMLTDVGKYRPPTLSFSNTHIQKAEIWLQHFDSPLLEGWVGTGKRALLFRLFLW